MGAMTLTIDEELAEVTAAVLDDYRQGREIDRVSDLCRQPDREKVFACVRKLLSVVYPGYYRDGGGRRCHSVGVELPALMEDVFSTLCEQVAIALETRALPGALPSVRPAVCVGPSAPPAACAGPARDLTLAFLRRLPAVRALLEDDLRAAFEGDPAAGSPAEIVMAYPGLFAVSVHRLAHELYRLDVPLLPRVMSEYAHGKTGVDIHPGAEIGRHFFIDHGTGVVIGQTARIGDNVRIYQGVTLGALSTRGGRKLRRARRHPTIEDDVVIYSGASILGGDTVIGRGSVIGGNAFITRSIKPGTRVSVRTNELDLREAREKSHADRPGDECWDYAI